MVLKRHARGRVERERVGNTSIDMKASKRKRGSMNEAYKTVLVDGLKQKIDTNKDNILEQDDDYALEKLYGVVGEREKCRAAKKRKRKGSVGELVDDSDIEEIDARYEIVLRHLKEGSKEQNFYHKHSRRNRCVAENLGERVHPAQGGERNMVQSRRKLKEVAGCANVVKGDQEYFERQMNLGRKNKKSDRTNVVKKEKSYLFGPRSKRVKEWPLEHANKAQSSETEKVQGQRYRQQLNKGKKAVGDKRKAVVLLDHGHFHHKRIQEKILPKEYGCKHAARAQPVKKCKEQIIGGELKGVVKEEVKKENEKTELMKVVRGDSGIASKKTVFVTVKKEPDHCVETDVHIKGIQSQIRCVNCAKPVPAEVEILDSDIFIKKRILSPFVPNQLHYSVRLFFEFVFFLLQFVFIKSYVMLHDM